MTKHTTFDPFAQFAPLFFETRQIIRQNLRGDKPDPSAWLRFETLRFIDEQGEPTMLDIANHLRIKAPSATSIIAHLAKKKLIDRKKDPNDRRTVRIVLSRAGEKALRGYRARSKATMERVFSKLPATDMHELIRILRRVSDAHRN